MCVIGVILSMSKNGNLTNTRKNMDGQLDQLKGLANNLSGLSSLLEKEASDSKKLRERLSNILYKIRKTSASNDLIPESERASPEQIQEARDEIEKLLESRINF